MNDKKNKVKQMDKFLEMYYLSRLNQKEIENMNRPVTANETESVITKLLMKKSPGSDIIAL